MELNILESGKNRLVFELKNTDHSFCNHLKEKLREQKDVDIATYGIQHPQVSHPKFIIETSKESPKKALETAIKEIKKENKEFLSEAKTLKD